MGDPEKTHTAQWFRLNAIESDIFEWDVWLLFGGVMLAERWAIGLFCRIPQKLGRTLLRKQPHSRPPD
jgi:hypothetical protein